jgi:TetR/AcrR family transcriptional regulator, regulator of cefoperazone and chloramphenicol sensitivity
MTENHHETRQRLLEAAAHVFTERGFRATNVRAIVERAGANVAAVNYHFGSKEALYLEVLRGICRTYAVQFETLQQAGPPEARLRLFVRSFLEQLLVHSTGLEARLFLRELSEPTSALDTVVEEVGRPVSTVLKALVRELAGDGLDEQEVAFCSQSIIAQCVFQESHQAFIQRLETHPTGVDALARHVTAFSLAGIRAIAEARRG